MSSPNFTFLKEEDLKPKKDSNFSFIASSKLEKKPQQQFSESDYLSEGQEEEAIQRGQTQAFSRIGETILGLPGDIGSFVSSLFGEEQDVLPTSQSLRKKSAELTSGYSEPQTELEEKFGELTSDIASMAIPGSKFYGFARNIGIPIVGNLAKEGLKYGNAEEKSQAYGKIGTMVALDLASGRTGGAKKHVRNLYQKAEQSIPKGLSVDASGLEKSLTDLEKQLSAGGLRPSTKKAIEKVGEIKNEIKNGKIDLKRLSAYRPSINEAIDEIGGFQLEVPKKAKPQAIRNLNQVKDSVIKTLDQYGEKFNLEFLKYNQSANEAYAAIKNSEKITNMLQKHIPYTPQSEAVKMLFSYAPVAGAIGLAKFSPGAAIGGAGLAGGYQGFKVLNRIKNSPTLRKYYLNVLKDASAGNVPQTTKNLKALDQLLLKEDQDQ